MDFLIHLLSLILVIVILVSVHEFGHYYVAIKCGVKVEEFSIGFGKELFGFFDKRGTRWKVCLIPLGGYVKMLGDMNAASVPDADKLKHIPKELQRTAFPFQPVLNRFLIVAAGPVANYVLAIILITLILLANGKQIISNIVDTVVENSPASRAGIQGGDKLVQIDGHNIKDFVEAKQIILLNPDTKLHFIFDRDGEKIEVDVLTESETIKDNTGTKSKVGKIGIVSKVEEKNLKKFNLFEALSESCRITFNITKLLFKTLTQMIKGQRDTGELGGPIKIAKYSAQSIQAGFTDFVWFIAMFSINLGFFNLLPIPLLDGGHLAFYIYEAISGKQPNIKIQEFSFKIGMAFLFLILVISFFNDIKSIFS